MKMNFQDKLETELPWSQKFREYPVVAEVYRNRHGGLVYPFRYEYDYQIDDSNSAQIVTFGDSEFVSYFSKDVFGNMHLDRLGGPATYKTKRGAITSFHYLLGGLRISPYEYWKLIHSEIYKGTYEFHQHSNELVFIKPKELPGPYSYNDKAKRFTWKLNGHRVSASQYWRCIETTFTTLRGSRNLQSEMNEDRKILAESTNRLKRKHSRIGTIINDIEKKTLTRGSK